VLAVQALGCLWAVWLWGAGEQRERVLSGSEVGFGSASGTGV